MVKIDIVALTFLQGAVNEHENGDGHNQFKADKRYLFLSRLTAVSNALENSLAARISIRLGTTSLYLILCRENKIGRGSGVYFNHEVA